MDIQTLTQEIQSKLNHLVDTKANSYVKTLVNDTEDEKEAKLSMYITDLTFEVSNKVIKDKISRINPKPLTFTFFIDRHKYFEQTVNDLIAQVNGEVSFDREAIKSQMEKIESNEPFCIKFNGYFLKDYGFMGSKEIAQTQEISENWFPCILNCMQVNEEDTNEAQEKLDFLRKLVSFGFGRALNMKYVFIGAENMDKSLQAVDYIMIGDKKSSVEEFIQFREKNALDRKKA